MISRVAESCFWLHRYVERVENTARMLSVNLNLLLDAHLPSLEHWRPFLIVAGEEPRFLELHGARAAEDGERVQEYLVWDEQSPASMISSLRWARENARTTRETISLEMWRAVNGFWLWMRDGEGRRVFDTERHAFYDHVRDSCHLFRGIGHDTVLHEEPFDFMRLGMLLERAGQTARILDLKHHVLGSDGRSPETPVDSAVWIAILRSCSAYEPFFKRGGHTLTGPAVARFLLLDEAFPRSVHYCVSRAHHFLQRIRAAGDPEVGRDSSERLAELLDRLRNRTPHASVRGVHEELTRLIDRLADASGAIQRDFFDPAEAGPPAAPADASAS